jgi:hypothetical protein
MDNLHTFFSPDAVGVIIGAIIGSLFPILNLIIENKKWKRERIIDYKIKKKENLEKMFSEICQSLIDGMKEEKFNMDVLNSLDYLVPEKVNKAFQGMLKAEIKTDDDKRRQIFFINRAMKESLADIDMEIEKEINKRIFFVL